MEATRSFFSGLFGSKHLDQLELGRQSIPDEIVREIFSHVDQKGLLALRETSKLFSSKADVLSEENKLLQTIRNEFDLVIKGKAKARRYYEDDNIPIIGSELELPIIGFHLKIVADNKGTHYERYGLGVLHEVNELDFLGKLKVSKVVVKAIIGFNQSMLGAEIEPLFDEAAKRNKAFTIGLKYYIENGSHYLSKLTIERTHPDVDIAPFLKKCEERINVLAQTYKIKLATS